MKHIYIFDSAFNFDTSVIAHFYLFILPIDFGSTKAPPHIFLSSYLLYVRWFFVFVVSFFFLFIASASGKSPHVCIYWLSSPPFETIKIILRLLIVCRISKSSQFSFNRIIVPDSEMMSRGGLKLVFRDKVCLRLLCHLTHLDIKQPSYNMVSSVSHAIKPNPIKPRMIIDIHYNMKRGLGNNFI